MPGGRPSEEEESIHVPIHRAFVPEELRGEANPAALVKIAYPVFVSVSGGAGEFGARAVRDTARADSSATVRVGTFSGVRAGRVQDMDSLARWALHRRIGAIKFRSTLRATAKQVALMKAKHDEEDEEKPFRMPGDDDGGFWRGILGWLLKDTVTHAVAEIEQADTRSCVTLPAEI